MTQVFSQPAMDTPVLTPGWTVQTASTGSNQNLTAVSPSAASLNALTLNGFLAQSIQTEDLTAAGVAMASGTLYGAKVTVEDMLVSTKGAVYIGTAGSVYTTTHGWLVLVDCNGNIVAQTADLTSTVGSASAGLLSASWASPATLNGGQYYVGAVQVGSGTTAPKLAGAANPSAVNNMNLTIPNASATLATGLDRFVTLATGLTTALPATPLANWGTNSTSVAADVTVQMFAALL